MLSIAKLRVGQEAYHLSGVAQSLDDYYTGAGEAAGWWVGGGAGRLGLHGEVDPDALRAVLAGIAPGTGGLNPNGKAIRPSARRVPGFDLTFKMPKSASVLYAVSDDPRVQGAIIDAGETAVREAIAWLEREAVRAQRGSHNKAWLDKLRAEDPDAARRDGPRRITTSGVVGAAFRHRTSRAGDPLLHWHVLVANLVEGNDGRWSAFAHPDVYRAARTAGEIFQAVTRRELTASLGVEWVRGRHVREIAGIPGSLSEVFSKRRAEIEAWLTAHGHADTPAAAQEATLATRRGRPEMESERLDAGWKREAVEHGWGPEQAEQLVAASCRHIAEDGLERVWRLTDAVFDDEYGTGVSHVDRVVGAEEWITALLRQVTQTATTFTRFDITEAVAARIGDGATVATIDRVVARVLASPQLVPVHEPDPPSPRGRTRYTSRAMLNIETRLLDTLTTTDAHQPVDPAIVEAAIAGRSTIGADQADAVRTLCAATGPVGVLIGPAGTGKTFTLDTVRAAYTTAGYSVIGAAPSARAAIELTAGAGIPARTLHSLIAAWERGLDTSDERTVLVIDEAGMTDVRLLERVTSHIHAVGGRAILVGDHHQLPEINAGGGFEAAATRTATGATLTENRRQHEPWEQAALAELRAGNVATAVRAYLDHDRVLVTPDRQAMVDTAVNAWHSARRAGRDAVLLAGTNEIVDVLNDAARRSLIDAGELPDQVDGTYGARGYRIGERVVMRRNSTRARTLDKRQIAVSNGHTGTVTAISDDGLTIRRDHDHELVTLDRRYLTAGGRVDHAYALTTTRAQGGTWTQAIAVGLDGLYREAAYVDFSRGRVDNLIVLTQTDADRVEELARDATERHDRNGIPLPTEHVLDIGDEIIDTVGQSRAKHLAHTVDATVSLVDRLAAASTLPDLEARYVQCRHAETIATDTVGIHPDQLRAAVSRAECTARHAHIGDRVKAFDRHNIGHIIGIDDTRGRILVAFESARGSYAERAFPWHELEHLEPHADERDLPEPAERRLDHLRTAAIETIRDWERHLGTHGVSVCEADNVRRAARRIVDRSTNHLIADQPAWLVNLIGYQPTDPVGNQTSTTAVRDIATFQLRHPAGTVSGDEAWSAMSERLLATRALLDRHERPQVAWPYRRSHPQLLARRNELDQILATAPPDQQPLIARLRRGDPQLIDDIATVLDGALEAQHARREWILEHWPHIVEYAEVTAILQHGLWGPDTYTLIKNLTPEPHSALADAIDNGEPWIAHAIGQLAPNWATHLGESAIDYLHDLADHRKRWNLASDQPLGRAPENAQESTERGQLIDRLHAVAKAPLQKDVELHGLAPTRPGPELGL